MQAAQVNPFSLQLFMNASFRGWLKLTKQNLGRRLEEQALGFDKVKMPTFVDVAEHSHHQSSIELSEDDQEDEIVYETVDDVEIEDTNSFVSEDIMGEDDDDDDEGDISRDRGASESEQDNRRHGKNRDKDSFHEVSSRAEDEESPPGGKRMPRKTMKYNEVTTPANTKEIEGEATLSGENSA